MKRLYLFQPQYSLIVNDEINYWIPYSVGCLWSYANQFDNIKKNVNLVDIIFQRESHEKILARMEEPDICAFSCYAWNRTYSFSLAEKIKQKWKNCTIVFGGPEINVIHTTYDYIDVVVLSEGEYAFHDILEKVISDVPLEKVYNKQRIQNLDLPSPYTTGVFDNIIANHPEAKWAMVLETNRGCPFHCTFCDWGSGVHSKMYKFNMDKIRQELEWVEKNPITYLFCADANFGIFKERDVEIAKLVKKAGDANPIFENFNVNFNKNNNKHSFEILKILGDLNRGFTVSVQSMHPPTLKAIKRENLGINDLKNIFKLCEEYNFNSYTELILGLPLETKESFISGIYELLELGQHNLIDVFFASTLTNAELNTPDSRFRYGIKTVSVKNYMIFNGTEDEPYDIIVETNTMTSEDIIDCATQSWLITNFHSHGYTQIVSKYCNKKFGISFRLFYEIFEKEMLSNKLFRELYNSVKENFKELITIGEPKNGLKGHTLINFGAEILYKNKEEILNILKKCLKKLTGTENEDIITLQSCFIFDKNKIYPLDIRVEGTSYRINSKISSSSIDKKIEDIYYLRKRGLLKNIIEYENF